MSSSQAHASVTARATGPEGVISGALDLVLEALPSMRIETRTHQDRTSLRPDEKDGIWLYATVVMEGEGPEEERQKAAGSLTFSPAGEGAGWLRLGEAVDTGGWKAVFVQAGSPGGEKGIATPGRVSLAVRGMALEQEIKSLVSFDLLPVPLLEADTEEVEFSEGSEASVEIKVFVKNPGTDPWEFEVQPDTGQEAVASAAVRPEGEASAVITLTRAGLETGAGSVGYRRSVLQITARQKDIILEKTLNVLLAVEGIEIIHRTYPDLQFRLRGDGKAVVEIDFAVICRVDGELASDEEMVKSLVFENRSEDTQAKNAVIAGELVIAFDRLRRLNTPYGVYTFRLAREVPADGRLLPAVIGVSAPGMGEKFSRTFPLGIETTDITPGSRAWEEEVRRTEEFIGKFIPVENRPEFLRILEARKHTLGVEGLFELRRRIWSAAQEIMLARGKSYEIDAEWAEYYLNIASWTKWLGDQAFAVVAGSLMGPGMALAACVTKDALVDALGRWAAGQSFEDYARSRAREVFQGIGEYISNPDELKKSFGYTKAYGIYFCWRFMYNLGTNNDEGKPRSAADAAWQAVKDCTATAVDSWLSGICEKEAIAKGWKKGQDPGPTGGTDGVSKGSPGEGGFDSGTSGDAGGKTGGKDARTSGGETGASEGRTGESGETRGKESRDSREKWEQDARERREDWEKKAGERREKWRKDAEDRRK